VTYLRVEIDHLRAEITSLEAQVQLGRDALQSCVDSENAKSVTIANLRHAIEGARDSFREIEALARGQWEKLAARFNPELSGKCACEPGSMCGLCIAREAAEAMESALRDDTIPAEDSPEDIELARKAFDFAAQAIEEPDGTG
jgi:hypothetical protein